MDCLELSIKNLENECLIWTKEINKEYKPELVIYVAKAGYLIGKVMSDVFNVPLIGINSERKGNGLKSILQPILKLIPTKVRFWLIKMELKSNIHKKDTERHTYFINSLESYNIENINKIIIVDDSVDTGNSIVAVKKVVQEYFINAEIKIASLNVWDKSEELIKTDYALYKNTIIKAPMSKDSKEYNQFINIYNSKK